MKILICLMNLAAMGLLPFAMLNADTRDAHGGVHVHIPFCESEEEEETPIPSVCMELKPWYHHQHFDEYEYIEDQAERLQDDTAWPSQREEFSDYLFR